MLASRNVSYDDQNCRPSCGYSYDNIGNRKTAQEPVGALAYSPYGQAVSTGDLVQPPSSGPARCTTKNPPWFITITAITTQKTEGGSIAIPSLNRVDGICTGLLGIRPF